MKEKLEESQEDIKYEKHITEGSPIGGGKQHRYEIVYKRYPNGVVEKVFGTEKDLGPVEGEKK